MPTTSKKIIHLEPSSEKTGILYFPKWEDIIADGYEPLKKVLLPFLKIKGTFIHPKYAGLSFCLMAHTDNIMDTVDYHLTADGKCEILELDDAKITTIADQKRIANEAEEDDEIFDSLPLSPVFLKTSTKSYSSYTIETGIPTWAQATFVDRELFLKIREHPELENSIDPTDYKSSYFKDDQGNQLEFVCATQSMYDVFGYHYLFYSPNTGLVRQFFQCT